MENRKAKNKNGGKAGKVGVTIKIAQGNKGLQFGNVLEKLYRSEGVQSMDELHEFGLVKNIHFNTAKKIPVGR